MIGFLKGMLIGPNDLTDPSNLIGPFDPKDFDDVMLIEFALLGLVHYSGLFFFF